MNSWNKTPKVFIVGGLLFGDEGKGTTVEYLTKKFEARLVVRYNGGPQAMHHVVFSDKSFHCFSQFGSGSFFPFCSTLLSKYMVVSPHTLLVEMEYLKRAGALDVQDRLFIDSECIIVTPMHKLINRLLETLRSQKKKYGTTGMGVGVTIDDAYASIPEKLPKGHLFSPSEKKGVTTLQIKDLLDEGILKEKIKKMITEKLKTFKEILENFKKDPKSVYENNFLEENIDTDVDTKFLSEANKMVTDFLKVHTPDSLFRFYWDFGQNFSKSFIDSCSLLSEFISKGHYIVMEGAQGAILDRIYGFYPHITKSICSADNALDLLSSLKTVPFEIIKVGVLRIYSSRHGNGPFLTHKSNWSNFIQEDHNSNSGWQGDFRIGTFDLVLAKYGIDIFKPDIISLTCIDKLLRAACENEEEIGKFPINVAYKPKKAEINENVFVINNETKLVEGIRKKKEEESWRNLELVKYLQNMEICEKFIDEFEDDQLCEKLRATTSDECRKRFKLRREEKKINDLAKYVAVIQKSLVVPIKVLSFGPTVHDKIFFDG